MAKPRMKLNVVIPDYPRGRRRKGKSRTRGLPWRRAIYDAILEEADAREIQYLKESKLDVSILLFMTYNQLGHGHDLDNMTKHLLDALQGKLAGAGKTAQTNFAIAPNDSQVRRLSIEKRERKTSKEKSRMIVRTYREGRRRGLV
jgi:Holliday junction resolvase RusA-like endonuclease